MDDAEQVVASFGGGVNSTAMLLGLHERNEYPDLVLFSDTGAEKPETYAFVRRLSDWLERAGRFAQLEETLRDAVSWQRGPFAGTTIIEIPAWLERAELALGQSGSEDKS